MIKRERQSISDQLHSTVLKEIARGKSVNQIAKEIGIPQPVLHRWQSGVRPDLFLSTAEKIAKHYGLTLGAE